MAILLHKFSLLNSSISSPRIPTRAPHLCPLSPAPCPFLLCDFFLALFVAQVCMIKINEHSLLNSPTLSLVPYLSSSKRKQWPSTLFIYRHYCLLSCPSLNIFILFAFYSYCLFQWFWQNSMLKITFHCLHIGFISKMIEHKFAFLVICYWCIWLHLLLKFHFKLPHTWWEKYFIFLTHFGQN